MIQIDKPMLQNCYDCPCTNDGFYRCLLADKQLEDDCEQRRPTWCPLHEVTDSDTISRQDAIEHLKKRLYESALNNEGVVSETMEEIADNRIQIWMDELPSSPSRPKGRWKTIAFLTVECPECHAQIHELEYDNFCPNCGADMRP